MSLSDILRNPEHDEEEFSDINAQREILVDHVFESCVFTRCNLSGADLSRTRFISCRFKDCDLSNVVLKNSRIRDTSFSSCKLIGIQWVHLDDLVNPSFDECILQYCNFVGLKLKKTKFFKCNLRDVDFSQADLSESDFNESDFSKARFHATTLIKSDFRGAVNYVIDPVGNKIRGARFSLPEAQGLLAGLGVIIS